MYIFVCLSYGIDFYHYFNFHRLGSFSLEDFLLPFKTTFLNEGTPLHTKNVLLVVAHPDDESIISD
ncbi:hypothetical protein ES332_D04G035900v1 [Gossypium tomentosum]|uniref:N-acetylglucosaminylphosphatidylinositol deacetylase n=1 Tax=Gossypium tomentosum TaxID=34277 RepID=A0A5D2L8M6_GOSTO|nr:hypothetical protein ES332_D04G035900v1 [Gossypium tomentosum]